MIKKVCVSLVMLIFLVMHAYAHSHKVSNMCVMFKRNPDWYSATQKTAKQWGVPISVQMAIIRQESDFNPYATPKATSYWGKHSSAHGYAQALNSTWYIYEAETGHYGAKRSNFRDADDFIGWFANRAHRSLGIDKKNAFHLYLAYHDGITGYRLHNYNRKHWVVSIANRVEKTAKTYQNQLDQCKESLS